MADCRRGESACAAAAVAGPVPEVAFTRNRRNLNDHVKPQLGFR